VNASDARKLIQNTLHVAEDGTIGPKTLQALTTLCGIPDDAPWPDNAPVVAGWTAVKATSFADPADVAAFRACKAHGNSDLACFAKGDNGVGKWGDDCTEGSGLACALPPEEWAQFGSAARNKLVEIDHDGTMVVAELRDTMPHRANITNGAGIDLSPDTCKALGISIPADAQVRWRWA
jgi:hypothetical protein